VAADEDRPAKEAKDAKDARNVTGVGLTVEPMPKWFEFQTKDTVNGWIANDDAKAMTEHAWEIWAAITTLTNQKLNGQPVPVFETWWDADEALRVKKVAAKPGIRRFERPVQLEHRDRARARALGRSLSQPEARPAQTLFDTVKYNDDI